MRTWIVLLAGASLVSAQEPRLLLQPLIDEALRVNPEIRAARKALEAARQRPAQAATMPEPMVGLGYSSAGGPLPGQGLGAEPTARLGFMVSQPLPAPGKLRLKGDMAAREAEAETAQYEQVRRTVVTRVKEAYHRLHHAWAQFELYERNLTLLTRILRITEARYAVGKAAQQDVLKAQSQLTLMEARKTRALQERRSREAELNMLLSRAPESPYGRPPDIDPVELPVGLDQLQAAVQASSPLLRRDRKMIERGQLALNMARKEALPDVTLSAGYYNMGRMPDMAEVRVDIPLTFIWRERQRAGVREQYALADQARSQYQATQQTLAFQVRDAYLLSEASWRLIRMYQTTLLPQATLTLESSLPAYETGQVDFLTLLMNVMTIFDVEMQWHEEVQNYHLALLKLEELTGLTLIQEVK